MKRRVTHIIKEKNQFKITKPRLIVDIICAAILLLFLYTALSKLLDFGNFKSVLIMSPLMRPFAGIIAWALPIAEIGIVLLLVFPKTKVKGLYTAFITLVIFTIYIIYMVIFTPRPPCSCGGVLKSLTWTQHIFFNLFWILMAVTGIAIYRQIKKVITVPP
jgi:hypothetical protein